MLIRELQRHMLQKFLFFCFSFMKKEKSWPHLTPTLDMPQLRLFQNVSLRFSGQQQIQLATSSYLPASTRGLY